MGHISSITIGERSNFQFEFLSRHRNRTSHQGQNVFTEYDVIIIINTKTSLVKPKIKVGMMEAMSFSFTTDVRYRIMQFIVARSAQTFGIKRTRGTLQRSYKHLRVKQTLSSRFVQDLKKIKKDRVTLEANNHKYLNPSLNTSPKPLHP